MPPRVNDGRMMSGKPMRPARTPALASSAVVAKKPLGISSPIRAMAAPKRFLSSAVLIAGSLAPISSTPKRSRVPSSARATARLRPVWPPTVGSMACGRSRSMTLATNSGVKGSMYVRSAISGSVMMVAGFELTSTTSKPSSRRALQAWVPE